LQLKKLGLRGPFKVGVTSRERRNLNDKVLLLLLHWKGDLMTVVPREGGRLIAQLKKKNLGFGGER
jgi:hypothetical protein